MSNIYCNYIGTFASDYLQDGHTRDGELLLYASSGHTCVNNLIEDLYDCALSDTKIPKNISDKEVYAAIKSEFKHYQVNSEDEEMNEDVYVYAYLEWETD